MVGNRYEAKDHGVYGDQMGHTDPPGDGGQNGRFYFGVRGDPPPLPKIITHLKPTTKLQSDMSYNRFKIWLKEWQIFLETSNLKLYQDHIRVAYFKSIIEDNFQVKIIARLSGQNSYKDWFSEIQEYIFIK